MPTCRRVPKLRFASRTLRVLRVETHEPDLARAMDLYSLWPIGGPGNVRSLAGTRCPCSWSAAAHECRRIGEAQRAPDVRRRAAFRALIRDDDVIAGASG